MKMIRRLLPLLMLTLAGCSGDGRPVFNDANYDAESARRTLVAALDAWQAGRAGELARRKPPIRFVDDDQRAGLRLMSYELADPAVTIRPFADIDVQLTVRDRSGKTMQRTATYQIVLSPGLAVLRTDL